MSRELTFLVCIIGATVLGNLAIAWCSAELVAWKQTRNWRKLIVPGVITVWTLVALRAAVFRNEDGANDDFALAAGGIIGALLATRAVFGIIRCSRFELAGAENYRGAFRDMAMILVALAPVFLMNYLLR